MSVRKALIKNIRTTVNQRERDAYLKKYQIKLFAAWSIIVLVWKAKAKNPEEPVGNKEEDGNHVDENVSFIPKQLI